MNTYAELTAAKTLSTAESRLADPLSDPSRAAIYYALRELLSERGEALDDELRAFNPDWGLHRREELEAHATRAGLEVPQRMEPPDGELLLAWEHTSRSPKRAKNMFWL